MELTVNALKNLYTALGGDPAAVADVDLIPNAINAIAGFVGIKDVNVQPEKQSATLFGTKVSDMQSGVAVADGAIIGTLKYLATGALAEYWGAGNFIALKFVNANSNVKIEAGFPTGGSGLVELDADMNGVWKINPERLTDGSKFTVKTTTADGLSKIQTYDISGLELLPAEN